jgi:hypothetical protein
MGRLPTTPAVRRDLVPGETAYRRHRGFAFRLPETGEQKPRRRGGAQPQRTPLAKKLLLRIEKTVTLNRVALLRLCLSGIHRGPGDEPDHIAW